MSDDAQRTVGTITHPTSQRSVEVFVEEGSVGMTVSFGVPSFTFRVEPCHAREIAAFLVAAAHRAENR
jgi:hypothetical protein